MSERTWFATNEIPSLHTNASRSSPANERRVISFARRINTGAMDHWVSFFESGISVVSALSLSPASKP